MTVKKTYLETKPECKVTFKLSKKVIPNTPEIVKLVGEFNDWDTESTPMKKLKTGDYSITVNLEKGREYQYKYLLDNNEWLNDDEADKYVVNEFQGENSVVVI